MTRCDTCIHAVICGYKRYMEDIIARFGDPDKLSEAGLPLLNISCNYYNSKDYLAPTPSQKKHTT